MFISCQLYKSSFIDFTGGGSKGGFIPLIGGGSKGGDIPLKIHGVSRKKMKNGKIVIIHTATKIPFLIFTFVSFIPFCILLLPVLPFLKHVICVPIRACNRRRFGLCYPRAEQTAITGNRGYQEGVRAHSDSSGGGPKNH